MPITLVLKQNFYRSKYACYLARKMRLSVVESPSDEAENNEETEEAGRHSDSADHELVDMFSEYYQPYVLTVLETLYPHLMQKSCRYVMAISFLVTMSVHFQPSKVVRIKTSSNEILSTAENLSKKPRN